MIVYENTLYSKTLRCFPIFMRRTTPVEPLEPLEPIEPIEPIKPAPPLSLNQRATCPEPRTPHLCYNRENHALHERNPPMKRSEPTLNDQIRSIHYKYEIPQDKAEALLSSGLRFLEIDKAALLSILAEVPIDTILDMRKDDPWGRIQKKLGLTAALYEERLLRHRARRLHRFYGIPEDRAIPLLQDGYPNHWLRLAYLLEQHTGASMEDILAARKKSEKWKPWAETHLGISPEDFTKWIAETRNPSLPKK